MNHCFVASVKPSVDPRETERPSGKRSRRLSLGIDYSFSSIVKIGLVPIPPGELEWLTDGRPRGEVIVFMGEYHFVFQVEVAAIMRCSQENLKLIYGNRNKVISIF